MSRSMENIALSFQLRKRSNLRTQLRIMPVIQITISQGRSVEQKRELVKVLTTETARIMKTEQEKIRILNLRGFKRELGKCWDFRFRYEIEG